MAPVLFYILSVVLSWTQMASLDNLTSLEVCHQIRDNRIKILAMGSRGYRDRADKHWVYLLAEGGYLFVVPFANLTVDPRLAKGNKLIIGGDYIDASTFFHINSQTLTANGQVRYQKFSFITDDHGQHYLMRLYSPLNSKGICIELYYLDSGTKASMTSSCSKDEGFATREHFLLSLDSADKSAEHIGQGSRFEAWAYEVGKEDMRLAYVFTAEQDQIMFKPRSPDDKHGLLSPTQPNITTAFGLILNDSATLVLLTDSGKVIVGERKHLYWDDVGFVNSMGQPLREFIECVVSEANTGWAFYWQHYKLWIVLSALGTSVIVLICAVWALCRCFKGNKNREASTDLDTGTEQEARTDREARKKKRHKKRDKKRQLKKKRHNKKSPATTTGANESQIDTSSGPTSDINTTINISSMLSRISGKIKSMLAQSAKSTNKVKKSKVDKKSSKDA